MILQESLRLLMALSEKHDLSLQQVDVTTALLNGTLEEVYMQQPKVSSVKERRSLYASLTKAFMV